jgi:predicted ATP-grasp superfamily ATP-dependent carboligase
MDTNIDKAIVIGCKVPGYAVIRALADKSVYVIALTYSVNDFAHLSKYVSEVVRTSPPEVNEGEFINVLVENGERWKGALILETSDAIAVALSRNEKILSRYYKVVTPDWEILKLFVEKEKTYALAKEFDIPHPKSLHLELQTDLKGIEKFKFPYILKPVRSHEFVSRFQAKNFKVSSEIELKEKLQLCLDAGFPVILQEIIPGPDDNLCTMLGYINSQGKLVGKFFQRKLRQNPPMFGVMRVGISIKKYEEMEQLTKKLLDPINYRGFFGIEFKKDVRDNQWKLMENNCRMIGPGFIATACGVNFPWIIYLDLVKNQQVDVPEYKIGTYLIELYADLSNSIQHHNFENIKLYDYIKPYLYIDKAFADVDFHDMKPFMRLTSQRLNNSWNKIAGRKTMEDD